VRTSDEGFILKRQGQLFEQAFTHDNLVQAFHDAAKSKRSRRGCFDFEKHLAINIKELHNELHSGNYCPKPYFTFTIHEPKERVIFAPAFRDCVVQHAIYRIVSPIFEATFIDQSFACRVGFGTHKAADYAQHALQQVPHDSYTLKLDIRKFFYRIDRAILKTLIEKKIKDQRMVRVMMLFTEHGEVLGIPIGNLLSQLYALIYLNPLDHYIKRALQIKYYCRYVDDFILFGITHKQAAAYQQLIIDYIDSNLNLELSKSTIAKVSKGINFVGYRTWSSKRFIRRRSLYNFKQAVKALKLDSIIAILGHARKTHTLNFLLTKLRETYADYLQLPKIYRSANQSYLTLT
jgi:RNA-directed DNA polymerase